MLDEADALDDRAALVDARARCAGWGSTGGGSAPSPWLLGLPVGLAAVGGGGYGAVRLRRRLKARAAARAWPTPTP